MHLILKHFPIVFLIRFFLKNANHASSAFHLFLLVCLPSLTFDSLGKLFSVALFHFSIFLSEMQITHRLFLLVAIPHIPHAFAAFAIIARFLLLFSEKPNFAFFVSKNANHPSSAFHLFLLVAIPHIPHAFAAAVSPLHLETLSHLCNASEQAHLYHNII